MARVCCSGCGTPLTVSLRRASVLNPAPVVPNDDGDESTNHALVERGTFALDSHPRTVQQRSRGMGPDSFEIIETDPAGTVLVHPDDRLPEALDEVPERSHGCCGLDGCDGPNQACANCGAIVGTARTDCWTDHEVRFWPTSVVVSVGGQLA